jgi:hypothetical protein
MKKILAYLAVLFISIISLQAQEWDVTETSDDDAYLWMFLTQGDSAFENNLYMPRIGLGTGVFTYFGDVNDNYRDPGVGRRGARLIITRNLNDFLDIDYLFTVGKLAGNSISEDLNYNFETEIICGGLAAKYNFEHFFKKKDELPAIPDEGPKTKFRPYISLGLEAFEYNTKTDLKDKNGYTYHYWSDGTLRNMAETSGNETSSLILNRDYVYETDLRMLSEEDGTEKYLQIAFAIPVEIGVEFEISKRIDFRLGAQYSFTLNDHIDHVSKNTSYPTTGNGRKDKFLFTYAALQFELYEKPEIPEYLRQHYDEIPAEVFEWGDEDNDKRLDLHDECAYTEEGIAVDIKGCPMDDDKDGIGQYMDEEMDSEEGAIVNLVGVTMPEDVLGDTLAILHKDICEWYPSLCRDDDGFLTKGWLVLPEEYKRFDTDGDEYISFDELNDVIDAWFDYKIDWTIEDILKFNDFFFEQ